VSGTEPISYTVNIKYLISQNHPNSRITTSKTCCFEFQVASIYITKLTKGDILSIPDLLIKNFVPLIDEKIQFCVEGKKSSRQRIINNLPGTIAFCPIIYKTPKLEEYVASNFQDQENFI